MSAGITVLGSGSKGNCTIVFSSTTRLLIDAGLSCRETLRRMAAVDESRESLDAIVISHEHSDHVAGLRVLARKLDIPVYMTAATHQAYRREFRDRNGQAVKFNKLEFFDPGRPFHIGDIAITAFTVPHDAVDPVGFCFRSEGVKIAIVTDLGYLPVSVADHIRGCDGLMIESNHDLEMLRGGPYPWSVKQRVMSRVGHLSNDALADFFSNDYDGGAAFLVLAHLSEENNHPEIARTVAERALGRRRDLLRNRLMLAAQAGPLEPIRL
jgi:phosphoribosyl 1,2-cyclic phosphodiesterase